VSRFGGAGALPTICTCSIAPRDHTVKTVPAHLASDPGFTASDGCSYAQKTHFFKFDHGECARDSFALPTPLESNMQLNLFHGTGASAIPVDRCTEAADKSGVVSHPYTHKTLAMPFSHHEESEALFGKLGNALKAFSDFSCRQIDEAQETTDPT
jgi:hypothetical protein